MWKLLISVIADQIYATLDQEKSLPEEQKGCRKDSRGSRKCSDFFGVAEKIKSLLVNSGKWKTGR